jgi:hypothetical protein
MSVGRQVVLKSVGQPREVLPKYLHKTRKIEPIIYQNAQDKYFVKEKPEKWQIF